jgi:hypothetical protein
LAIHRTGQFSTERYAFLFKPGSYDIDCPVGYYTTIHGLGTAPTDVVFTSPKGVYSQEGDFTSTGALDSFWRSAENFRTSASNKWYVGTGMMWAVSQVLYTLLVRLLDSATGFFSSFQHLIPKRVA